MAAIREKKSFYPTRPAMGESQPIGAMRWHRQNETGCEAEGYAGVSKGGRAPPFVSSRMRGTRGRNPIERVSPSVRVFAYFFHEEKVGRGPGVKPREPPNRMAAIREKKCFSPTRPAIRESQPIGAMRWHRQNETGCEAEGPKNLTSSTVRGTAAAAAA